MKRNTALWFLMLWTLSMVLMAGCSTETEKDTTQQEAPKTETAAETPLEATSETESATSAPRLVIPEALFEFKPVLENAYVTHKFLVQNKGTAELSIAKVNSG